MGISVSASDIVSCEFKVTVIPFVNRRFVSLSTYRCHKVCDDADGVFRSAQQGHLYLPLQFPL